MKDHLTALTEAVRLARLEIACHHDKDCRATAEYAIKRLDALLNARQVDQAIAAFAPEEASPSIVPQMQERNASKLHH